MWYALYCYPLEMLLFDCVTHPLLAASQTCPELCGYTCMRQRPKTKVHSQDIGLTYYGFLAAAVKWVK